MKNLTKLCSMLQCVVVLAAGFLSYNVAYAAGQSDKLQKQLEKAQSKMVKQIVKDLKSEGWKLSNNNTTIDVAVLEYQIKKSDPTHKYVEVIGEVSKCRSLNIGRMSAVNNAQNNLAQIMSGQIEGCVASLFEADAENVQNEKDGMVGGFTKKVKASLSGALTEGYSIYKENADGTYHYKTFFLADSDKCIDAASSAMEKSLQESKIALDKAEQIRAFVKNGMTIE